MKGNHRMGEIMGQIREHLKPVIDSGAGGNVHHYNRAWEKIDAWFKKWSTGETNDDDEFMKALNKTFMKNRR